MPKVDPTMLKVIGHATALACACEATTEESATFSRLIGRISIYASIFPKLPKLRSPVYDAQALDYTTSVHELNAYLSQYLTSVLRIHDAKES